MPTSKHFVLDDDVHKALIARREMTGLPISRIGNGILRGRIAGVALEDLVGRRLVELGKVSQEEYREILREAETDMRRTFVPGRAPIEMLGPGRMVSGSWEIESVICPPDRAFHLLECWARDSLHQPMAQHTHTSDEYIVSLAGKALFILMGMPHTMVKGNVLQIPAGAAHSALPLDDDAHLLVLTVPAAEEYAPHVG